MGEMCLWFYDIGLWWFFVVGWVECGGSFVNGYGNFVLCFYIIWGIGSGVLEYFICCCKEYEVCGLIIFKYCY